MRLLDHFHPPLSQHRTWEGFHSLWAATIVEKLNGGILSNEFHADMHVYIGRSIEIDVATLREKANSFPSNSPVWTPPPSDFVFAASFPDDVEVQIYATSAGPTLAGAIELVSPGNKDRPEHRRAFVAKCAGYLARGVGLLVVDIVTNRLVNLHNEIIQFLDLDPQLAFQPPIATYAVAYRPISNSKNPQVELWRRPLQIGDPLPEMPLGLLDAAVIPVDLQSTYHEACLRLRMPQLSG